MRRITVENRETWNEFVRASAYGHSLQSWEWGELKRKSGWQPVRVALSENGTIRAGAQILIRSLPGPAGRLAYVPKGPVLDYEDSALLQMFMATLRAISSERGVISLKVEPEIPAPSPVSGELLALGLQQAPPVQMVSTIWVDLTATEEDILARQKQKTRYNIRLAGRKGVTVSEAGRDQIPDWYRVFQETAKRDGFTIHGEQYYLDVLATLGGAGIATLLLAHHDGDLLGGIIVFCFGRTAQYMYGASGEKRNLMAPYLLQWEGMKWARARGASTYDMWGIPDRLDEGEDLWGVYRHKRGYGGEIIRYIGAFDIVQSPLRQFGLERVARPLFKRLARSGLQV